MDTLNEKRTNRFKLLNAVYDKVSGDSSRPIDIEDLGSDLGFNKGEISSLCVYLREEGLIKSAPFGRATNISHKGVREVEAALSTPEVSTYYFPAVMNITNIHGSITNSQLQQGTHESSQTLTLSQEDSAKLGEFVAEFARVVDAMALSLDDKAEASSEISTLQAQMKSPKPKSAIISESVKSLFRILEGVASNSIAAGLLHQFAGLNS